MCVLSKDSANYHFFVCYQLEHIVFVCCDSDEDPVLWQINAGNRLIPRGSHTFVALLCAKVLKKKVLLATYSCTCLPLSVKKPLSRVVNLNKSRVNFTYSRWISLTGLTKENRADCSFAKRSIGHI